MKKIISAIILLAITLSILVSCTTPTSIAKRGKIEDQVYTNQSAKIKFTKPQGWRFMTDDEIAENMNVTKDMLQNEDLINSANITTVIDFIAVDGWSATNNVNLAFENLLVSGSVGISVEKYCSLSKKNLQDQIVDIKYTFEEDSTVTIAGEEYVKLTAKCTYYGTSMTQYMYVRKLGVHMLVITATTGDNSPSSYFENMFSKAE